MMERGQLMLVDGKPAEFVEYQDDADGYYITYRTLGERAEHWLSMNSFAIRARVPKWRDG